MHLDSNVGLQILFPMLLFFKLKICIFTLQIFKHLIKVSKSCLESMSYFVLQHDDTLETQGLQILGHGVKISCRSFLNSYTAFSTLLQILSPFLPRIPMCSTYYVLRNLQLLSSSSLSLFLVCCDLGNLKPSLYDHLYIIKAQRLRVLCCGCSVMSDSLKHQGLQHARHA